MHHEREQSRRRARRADDKGDDAESFRLGKISRSALMRKADQSVASGLAPGASQLVDAAGASGGAPLPSGLRRTFEASLGADLSAVRVHVGEDSALAARAVGAKAYTVGNDIHFAAGTYDPSSAAGMHLLAHEVAHTVQQAGGTQLQCKLEVSSPGDHLEQEADRAADVMVAAAMTGSAAKANVSSGGGGAVQRKAVDTDYGRFETSTFKQKNAGDGVTPIGVDIVLDFVPGPKVDATSIGLVQSVLVQIFGETAVVDPTKDKKQVKTGLGAGSTIDKVPEEVDPIYPSENAKSTGGLGSGKPNAGELGEYGWHYRDAGSLRTKNARLIDQPVHPTWKSTDAIPKVDKDGNKRKVLPFGSQEFETAALVLEGTQKGSYLGSVEWGFDLSVVGGALVFTGKDIELRAGSMPSAGFMAAAKEWNASTALGTVKTRAGAGLYDHDLATRLKTMVAGTTVKLIKRMVRNGVVWYGVELSKTESGMMMLKELEDMGDGEATIDLPIQSWGRVKTSAALMSGPGSGDKLVDLPVEQLVKVMEQGKTWLHVETDASSLKKAPTAKPDVAGMVRGYVERAKLIV